MSQTTFEDFENVQTIQPHKEYYLNGGDLYFLVSEQYYRFSLMHALMQSTGGRLSFSSPPVLF